MPHRLLPLMLVTLFAAALLTAPSAAYAAASKQPNIVFIFADDLAYQATGAYGSKIHQTPAIDKFAEQGMRFDRCYVTNSICGPMRAVCLTGKYSHLNGFYQNGDKFDGSQQTMPKLLQKAGYQTAVIGKWHLETDPTGFDHWQILPGQGAYYNPPMKTAQGPVKLEGYTTDLIGDLALDWLEKGRDKSKPFMLLYWHKAPHRSWEPPVRYLDRYKDVTFPEPATLFDDYSGRGTAAKTQDMTIEKTMTEQDLKLTFPRTLNPEQLAAWEKSYGPENDAFRKANLQGKDLVRWKYQRYIKDYFRTVDALDDNIGRMLEYLDKSGLAENTLVVISSDQGFYLGEHGWFDKRWMYEESFKNILLVRWPGVTKPGSTNGDIVSNLDLAQTFLDAAGVPQPSDMQGRSLVPLLKGQTPSDWRTTFYYHYYEFPGAHSVARHYGVTDGRYKLIHFYDLNEWELYDLQTDPREMNSVYGKPEMAQVQQRLTAELSRLRAEYKVPAQDPESTRRKPGPGPGKKAQKKAKNQ